MRLASRFDRFSFLTFVLCAVTLAACGDDGEMSSGVEADYARGGADMAVSAEALSATIPSVAQQPMPTPARPRMLIRTGSATIEVEAIDGAVESVRQIAERMGGFLASVAVSGGRDQTRTATLALRVPSDRFDETLAALDSLGEVESVHVDSEDVGEAFADLEIRIANARRLEQRLLDLLSTRTGDLEDVLAVERELARVRQEIESMDAHMRSIRDRVQLSSISVMLHEPEPLFSSGGGENVLVRSIRQAGRNFVGFVAGFIASLGVILPLTVLLLAALGLWRLWRRRRQSRGD